MKKYFFILLIFMLTSFVLLYSKNRYLNITAGKRTVLMTKYQAVRVRQSPSINSKHLSTLQWRRWVIFTGKRSSKTETIKIRGKNTTEYWYEVDYLFDFVDNKYVTKSGWIFGGLLLPKPTVEILTPGKFDFFNYNSNKNYIAISKYKLFYNNPIFRKYSVKDYENKIKSCIQIESSSKTLLFWVSGLNLKPKTFKESPSPLREIKNYNDITLTFSYKGITYELYQKNIGIRKNDRGIFLKKGNTIQQLQYDSFSDEGQ